MIGATEIVGLSTERTPLRKVIQQLPNPTKSEVKRLYGDIGVDIFEGKEKITIFKPEESDQPRKSMLRRVSEWWNGNNKFDYEDKDSVKDLVLKYAYNNTRGNYEEIEEKFGQEGLKVASIFKIIGFFNKPGI